MKICVHAGDGLPYCPKCGAPAVLRKDKNRGIYQVRCFNQNCCMRTDWMSRDNALAMWEFITGEEITFHD